MVASASTLPSAALPVSRTRLVGREAELAAACAFLVVDAVPLLTLTGTGGVGKTRLALAAGHAIAGSFARGADFVDLAPLADANLVAATVASVLGVVPVPDRSVEEAIVGHLHREQRLLILDNCEHVLDAVADLVAKVLAACPAVQVMATSRAPLSIRGEQMLLLEPLPLPSPARALSPELLGQNEAVVLFTERARAVSSRFSVTNDNAQVIVQICRALDGLPLAIELAAARMRILSPEVLLAQMSDHWQLLRGGPRDLHPRQQSLQVTIAWSYRLLSHDDQRLFRRLAVFAGGWTLEAAAAVGELPENEVLLGLERIVDQSLVRVLGREGEPRFAMLETMRAFGLECLSVDNDACDARDLHAAYFQDLATRAEPDLELGRYSTGWLARLDDERDNVRAALTWRLERGDAERALHITGAMTEYWAFRSEFREGCSWCDRALALAERVTSARARSGALYGMAILASFQGDHSRAVAAAQQMLQIAEGNQDSTEQVRAHFALSFAMRHQETLDQALEHARAALALGRRIGAYGWVGWALTELAQNPLGQDAASAGEEALHIFRSLGSELGQVNALAILADLAASRSDTLRAASYYQESLALRQTIQDRWGMAKILLAIATLASGCHRVEEAARLLAAAVTWAGNVSYSMDYIVSKKPRELSIALQHRLDPSAFEEAWCSGASMTPQEVTSLAEMLLTDLTSDNAQKCSKVYSSPINSDQIATFSTRPRPTSHVRGTKPDFSLTRREREILTLLCLRLTDPEIGERLFISPRTVSRHVANLYLRLDVTNRRDAAALAVRHALV